MFSAVGIGLEMEAAGVTAMLRTTSTSPEFLLIKAAVDNCDGSTSDLWHAYGAEAAARFGYAVLKAAPRLAPATGDVFINRPVSITDTHPKVCVDALFYRPCDGCG
jgi:hypothetical protein